MSKRAKRLFLSLLSKTIVLSTLFLAGTALAIPLPNCVVIAEGYLGPNHSTNVEIQCTCPDGQEIKPANVNPPSASTMNMGSTSVNLILTTPSAVCVNAS